MDTGKAIFFGLTLIALAIFARDLVPSATAASGVIGRYAIANIDNSHFQYWKMDTATGRVEMCNFNEGC